jgi:hypothetical protein
MNWLAKAAAYKILSALPGGPILYRYSQIKITKSLSATSDRVKQKIDVGLKYFDWLSNNQMPGHVTKGVHLDFGAGWHPTIPLLYYCLGADRQYLFDVTFNLDGSMVEQTVKVFRDIVTDPQSPYRARLQRLPPPIPDSNWGAYLEQLGIIYRAPYGNAFKDLAEGVNLVTSTQVLLHVPRSAMLDCFKQIRASLKPGGVFIATVYLRDILTGNPHTSVDKYNRLRYSPRTWDRWINSSLMQFNRFKAPDYRELLEQAGFDLPHFEVEPATVEDYAELDRIRVAPYFKRYTREELAARSLFFVAQKR